MINNWKKFNEELNKSTYLKAAGEAEKKGLMGLSKRFKEHGKEFGIDPKSNIITFCRKGGICQEIEIGQVEIISNEITIFGKTPDGKFSRYEGFIDPQGIQLWLSGNYESLPKTRQDANRLLKILSDEGLDCSKVDTRGFTAEDVWVMPIS